MSIMNKKVLFLVLSATLLSFSNNSYANICSEAGLIEVNGHGQVESIPDLAVLSYSAKNEEKNAKDAREKTEKQITKLYESAQKSGFKKEHIVSSTISLYPRYSYTNEGKRVFEGYVATRDITFKVADFSLIEKLTTAAVDAGITEINGFEYTIKDTKKLEDEANQKAINDAKNKASVLAKGFGVKIKKACSLKFTNSNNVSSYRLQSRMAKVATLAVANDENDSNTEYSPEKITISSDVYASFAIKD